MKTKNIFPLYIHYSIYFLSAIIFAYYLDIGMKDDGLRHISFAANSEIMKNWGEVFPHSLFSNYDPWFLWHKLISLFLFFFSYENVHIAINSLSIFALMILLDKHLTRYVKFDFGNLIYIIVFAVLFTTSYRYWIVRPDLLSGLFVFSALLLKNRFFPIFILTLLYAPFYYLFFLYTGSLGLVYLVQKKYRLFSGVFTASVIVLLYFLIQDFQAYTSTVIYVLTDQSLRMGLEVTEGKPVFSILNNLNYFILLPLFLTISAGLIYYKYDYFSKNTLATFLLISSILWINQYRYYHLFLPFITIYLLSIFINSDKKQLFYKLRKYIILAKRYYIFAKNTKIIYLIAIPYAVIMFGIAFNSINKKEELQNALFFKDQFYDNKTILSNKMNLDTYKGLYYNPTVKFIPSCSIGWFDSKDKDMKDIYIKMQKEEGISEKELSELIKYTNADIYIHHMENEKQELSFKKLEQYGIIPFKIFQNHIIFKIKKSVK